MTHAAPADRAIEAFTRAFGSAPRAIGLAPGRINIIGEHTDYAGGLALPMAIDLVTAVAIAPGDGRAVSCDATDEPPRTLAHLDAPGWRRYAASVLGVLCEEHAVDGRVDLAVASDVPIGAGLSSSASLELAVLCAAERLAGLTLEPMQRALYAQRAEHRAGVPCGVMDQVASACAHEGSALRLDCSTLQITRAKLPTAPHEWIVVDTPKRRDLAAGAYGLRVREAEEIRECRASGAVLDEVLIRRARHIDTENRRVDEMVNALAANDLEGAGRLLRASHASLRDDCEVSLPAIDRIVGQLCEMVGVFGSRVMGGGFGGSVLVLAVPGTAERIGRFTTLAVRVVASGGPASGRTLDH